MRLPPHASARRVAGRLFVAALRGALIGAFAVTTGLALVLDASGLWAQLPLPAPDERGLALAMPVSVLVFLLGMTLFFASASLDVRERLFGPWVDRLPYSSFGLLSVVVAVSAAAFIHPELKTSLNLTLAGIERGEVWRLVTVTAIHLSPGHLANNVLGTAFLVPSLIFLKVGGKRFWATVGVSLASAAVVSLPAYPDGSLGLSQVLAGLSGVILVVGVQELRQQGDRWMWPLYGVILIPAGWTVVSMTFMALTGAEVNNVAHIAGILAGAAVGALPIAAEMRRRRDRVPAIGSASGNLLEQVAT